MITTFKLIKGSETISPALITIREYGTWFEKTFDNYTSQMELYLKSKKKTGESMLEWHPGTRLGKWFDSHNLDSVIYKSWYIMKDSKVMDRLVKLNLAEYKDAIPISVNDEEGRRMIRVYTVQQIELYLKQNIDKNFSIAQYVGTPKQIKVVNSELDKLVMPKVNMARKRLF